MTLTEFAYALIAPLRSATTLVVMISFYLLLGLAALAGVLGLWLAIMIVPALFRYLVMLAAAHAAGRKDQPPGIEYFSLAGNLWTLFPAIPVVLFAQGMKLTLSYGTPWALLFAALSVSLLPAMMAILVITHSPLECMNPRALLRLVQRVGAGYLYAPLVAAAIVWVPWQFESLPGWGLGLIELYLAFSFYVVIGAMLRNERLIDEVDIPEPLQPDAAVRKTELVAERTRVLNHAYGFASRGNRDGALQHIRDWLQHDPEPDAGWQWFFEQMLRWEQSDHALFFAQQYLARLLANGRQVQAVKVLLRGRMLNERFRTLPEDLPRAIEAAEATGNEALADALRRS